MNTPEEIPTAHSNWSTTRKVIYVLGTLLLFVFALDLMISSLQHLGRDTVETILLATSNPFTALFIGLLITAMIQSSSTTTSLVVALVASGAIRLEAAVPIIMGANIGTTITSTIVSLGFINKKKEFRRAVTIGAYHDFFNILTVILLFPLEYYYSLISRVARQISARFFSVSPPSSREDFTTIWSGFDPFINYLVETIQSGFVLAIVSFALLFISILLFRRIISRMLMAGSPQKFSRFFFKSSAKSFFWGFVTTAAIRSSTITTSVVVPIVAQKIVQLKKAVPFILGANLGTTITAFIAASLNVNTRSAISIAVVHLLFNAIGVIVWYPLPFFRQIPVRIASLLGKLSLTYRLVGLVYILIFFFFIPFSLIYISRNSASVIEATMKRVEYQSGEESIYQIISKTHTQNQTGEWLIYKGQDRDPTFIHQVYQRTNMLLVDEQAYLFKPVGFCWDSDDTRTQNQTCVEAVYSSAELSIGLAVDSVYVFRQQFIRESDTTVNRIFISKDLPLILKKETSINGKKLVTESIVSMKKN